MGLHIICIAYFLPKFVYRRIGVFPSRNSLRIKAIWESQVWKSPEETKRVLRGWYHQRRTLSIVGLLLIVTIILWLLLDLALQSPAWNEVSTIWQIHASVVGLNFIVIVFLIDFVSRSSHVEGVLKQFVRKSYIKPVLYYSLLGILAIGIFYLYPQLRIDTVTPNLSTAFFTVTVAGIILVYLKILQLMLTESPEHNTYQLLQEELSSTIDADTSIYRYDRTWSGHLIDNAVIEPSGYAPIPSGAEHVSAAELGLSGHIVDINFAEFNSALENIPLEENPSEEDENDKITVRAKIGQNLRDSSIILYVSQSHDIPDVVHQRLSNSILTRTTPLWEHTVPRIYELLDSVEQDGREAVRRGESRAFNRFEFNYEEVVQHLFDELTENRYLLEEHRLGRGDLPVDYFAEVLSRVFEETIAAQNRWMAIHTIQTLQPIIQTSIEKELYLFFRPYLEQLSNFYLRICLRRTDTPDFFSSAITDEFLLVFNTVSRECIAKDLDNVECLDELKPWLENYSIPLFEELHKMLKYAIEADDNRMFNRLWSEPSVPRDHENTTIKEWLESDIEQIRFSSATLAYAIAAENEERRDFFDTVYNQDINTRYHQLRSLFKAYKDTTDSERNPDWTRWQRQEHDLIQGRFGKPISINEVEMREFYCFVGILNLHISAVEDRNPLKGMSIDEQEFRKIRLTAGDLKRDNPLVTVSEFVDEDQFEEQADRFIEYHKEIIDSDDE